MLISDAGTRRGSSAVAMVIKSGTPSVEMSMKSRQPARVMKPFARPVASKWTATKSGSCPARLKISAAAAASSITNKSRGNLRIDGDRDTALRDAARWGGPRCTRSAVRMPIAWTILDALRSRIVNGKDVDFKDLGRLAADRARRGDAYLE